MTMLDDNRLAEIRERASGELREFLCGELGHSDGECLVCEDVPALLVEVERLRTAEESATVENARLRTAAENAQDCYVTEMAAHSRTRIELEAAKGDLHLFAQCVTCEHTYDGGMRCRVPIKAREHKGDYCSTWQWRGAPANTPDAREGMKGEAE